MNTATIINFDNKRAASMPDKESDGYGLSDRLRWAWKQQTGSAPCKSVLLALTECAGENGRVWPSAAHLAEVTELNIKTVYTAIDWLREIGLISDTGDRMGSTGQVIIYQLHFDRYCTVTKDRKDTRKRVSSKPKTPENGSVKNNERHPFFPAKTPVFSDKTPENGSRNHPLTTQRTKEGYIPPKPPLDPEQREDATASSVTPQAVVDIFNQTLRELPAVQKLTAARITAIRQRTGDSFPTEAAWKSYFSSVLDSDFLMGRGVGKNGQTPFVASFDWLLKPANVAKVLEGNYRNRYPSAAVSHAEQARQATLEYEKDRARKMIFFDEV